MDLTFIYDHLITFGPILISGVIGFVFGYSLVWLFSKLYVKIWNTDAQLLFALRKPLAILVMIVFLYLSSKYYYDSLNEYWRQALEIITIISLSWLFINLAGLGRALLTRQYNTDDPNNLKARKVYTQIRVFERIIVVLIVVMGSAFVLMTFDSIKSFGASIIASAGIASVIVGLAAQRLIANLLAGFQIAITQPIRLDDVVIIEKEWGWIEEITLTYVVVRVWDKRRLIVPSTQFIEKPFQNWTRNSSDILGTVFIYLDYQFPVDALRNELNKLLENNELWDGKVNVVQVTDLTNLVMEIRVLVSAKNSPTAWDLRVHIREKLIEFLQREYPEYLPRTRVMLEKEERKEND
ncbi:MAG: mechanosensitive ion channel [Cyclobacteriaceae bacterium]